MLRGERSCLLLLIRCSCCKHISAWVSGKCYKCISALHSVTASGCEPPRAEICCRIRRLGSSLAGAQRLPIGRVQWDSPASGRLQLTVDRLLGAGVRGERWTDGCRRAAAEMHQPELCCALLLTIAVSGRGIEEGGSPAGLALMAGPAITAQRTGASLRQQP